MEVEVKNRDMQSGITVKDVEETWFDDKDRYVMRLKDRAGMAYVMMCDVFSIIERVE